MLRYLRSFSMPGSRTESGNGALSNVGELEVSLAASSATSDTSSQQGHRPTVAQEMCDKRCLRQRR